MAAERKEKELTEQDIQDAIKRGEDAAAEDLHHDVDEVSRQAEELATQLEQARDENEAVRQEAANAKERLARVQADWDNFRKRTQQERAVEKDRAAMRVVEQLLPALDDMEAAIEHAENNAEPEVAQGMKQVYQKIQETLQKEGVSVINPVGEHFDPSFEQAVSQIEDTSVPAETVAQVLRKGYVMGGRTLREAMVVVTQGGPAYEAPKDEASE